MPPLPRHQGYRVAWLMALVHMLAVGDRFLLSILIEPIKADLGLGDAVIGALQGPAFAIVNGVAIIPMILLARRWPLARLLAVALAGSSVATIACGLATSGGMLAGARMMLGLAQAAIGPAAMGLIVAAIAPAHRGRGISLFTGGASLGRGLAMIGGGALLALFALLGGAVAPWRAVFVAGGAIGLPLALVLSRMASPDARPQGGGQPMGEALRRMIADARVLLPHILAALCAVLVIQSLTSWSASLLIRLHGLTPPRAGLYVGLAMMLAGAFGHVLGGMLADRWGRGAPGLMLLGLAVATLALWPLTRASDLMLALAALVVAVVGLSITLANGLIGLQQRVPSDLRVEGTAIFLTLVTLLGTALGPWAVGAAAQAIAGPTGLADAIGRVLGMTGLVGCGAGLVAMRANRGDRPQGGEVAGRRA
ncbi:MFS transporter [uncultured Sphingomonas sp.]|uniref:MFS transporter n=1 Tax=uncultured Sphingomonas sp. TaxID=158754 RepID=UPI00374894F4